MNNWGSLDEVRRETRDQEIKVRTELGKLEAKKGFEKELSKVKDKEIETDIPDQWPKVAKFLRDGVHIEKQEGDIRWLCYVCKNTYYANESVKFTKCPYCGVNIKKINLIEANKSGKDRSPAHHDSKIEAGAK